MQAASRNRAIVIGAGPAGLGAAMGLSHKCFEVTVFEQQKSLGTVRRGETIRADIHMEHLLGTGFFQKIALRHVNRRRYYSHTGGCHVDRTIKNPNIIISWPDFIREVAGMLERSGIRIITGLCVESFMEREGVVHGVTVRHNGSEERHEACTVISCGGHDDPAARFIAQDRTGIDKDIVKRLVKGYAGPDDRLIYQFHTGLEGFIVGTVFPRGGGEAEFILLNTLSGPHPLPTFEEFGQMHAEFGRLLSGTQTFYDLKTRIPMGGMLYPFSPKPGLVMAGDALGHVQARGGSGIRASFLIGHAAGSLCADMKDQGWDEHTRRRFEKAMQRHPHVLSLRLHNLVYATLRSRIFSLVKTPEDMDRLWPVLSLALR